MVQSIPLETRYAACAPQHLALVLEKLLDNAVKFNDKENAQICVTAERTSDSWIRIEVADNGPGIPHEFYDKIFEPFVQVEDLPTGQVPGLGVGLTMARQVVEAFGGAISVTSQLGEGSRFSFTVPSSEEENRAASARPVD